MDDHPLEGCNPWKTKSAQNLKQENETVIVPGKWSFVSRSILVRKHFSVWPPWGGVGGAFLPAELKVT